MLLWPYKLKRKISPRQYIRLLGAHDLGKKQSNRLLQKTGVVTQGSAVIRPPFYFERGQIDLGHGVLINAGCVFLDQALITIGDNALLGPQVRLCTTTHDLDPETRHRNTRSSPIVIGRNAWLGAGVVVLPGVTIGENSVIGANSVVTASVPANAVYAGAPARWIKWLSGDQAQRSLESDPAQ